MTYFLEGDGGEAPLVPSVTPDVAPATWWQGTGAAAEKEIYDANVFSARRHAEEFAGQSHLQSVSGSTH